VWSCNAGFGVCVVRHINEKKKSVTFDSKSGLLTVKKKKRTSVNGFSVLGSPKKLMIYPPDLKKCLGITEIVAVYKIA
jgi:hypothetical protein